MGEWYRDLGIAASQVAKAPGLAPLFGGDVTQSAGQAMQGMGLSAGQSNAASIGGGALGVLGNLAGGVGDLMAGDTGGWGRLTNAATGTVSTIAKAAGSSMFNAGTTGGGILGTIGGAANLVSNGLEAYEHRDERNGDYMGNAFWKNTGEASLGAAHMATAWCPVADLYLTAGETAVNLVGMGAGYLGEGIESAGKWLGLLDEDTDIDLGFNAGSVVGGVMHAGHDAMNWAGGLLGMDDMWGEDTAGTAIGTALGSIGGPIGMMVGGVLGGAAEHYGGAAIDAVGGALGSVGSGIADVASSAWDTAGDVVGGIGSAIGGLFSW